MTFEARETSIQDGAPIELWVFQVYGVSYRYTTASEDYVFLSSTYKREVLSHSELEQTTEIKKNNVTLFVPGNFEIMQFYESMPPSDVIKLTIFETHRGDSDVISGWTGRVLNGMRKGPVAELYAENILTAGQRMGLRRPWCRQCPHVHYDPNSCKGPEADFEFTATLDSVAGRTLQSTAFQTAPAGEVPTGLSMAGGVIEYEPTPGRIEKRGVKSHTGSTIEITHPIDGMPTLATVRALPGCRHNPDDCVRYNNRDNYGGVNHMTRKNPMGNVSVF